MENATPIPERIGPYRPVAVLGKGGMGVVYRAEHTRHPGHYVALKVILESTDMDSEDARRRFQREARLLEGLRHPNIVSFLEVGLDGLRQYFAMELLEGRPLSAYTGCSCQTLAPLLIQICRGMHYLASRSIVHRDLSPGNVLIVEKEKVPLAKILDFGIAKDIEAKETLHTRTGLIMGKPKYWSPEQLGSLGPGRLLDWRSDVYTLGVIFFQVFSGRLPFECESPYQYASAHLFQPPPPLEAPPGHPPLPEALISIVARMLAKSADERPEYREIIEVLARMIEAQDGREATLVARSDSTGFTSLTTDSISLSARRPTVPFETRPIQSAPRTGRFRVRTAIGVGVAAGLALVLVAVLSNRLRSRQVSPVPSPETRTLTEGVVPEPTSRPPGPVLGILNLDAVPWAKVDAIVSESTGTKIPVAEDLTTPVSLELPPGRYRVEIVCGTRNERRNLVIDVMSGTITSVNEGFGEPRDLLTLLD